MKRIGKLLCLLTAIAIIATALPLMGRAQNGLSIESTKVYDGMDKRYSQGYMPKVANGKALIILPLTGDTQGDCITVTPQLDTEGPFVYGNYQFNVNKVNGVFLVKLNLPLKADRKNGLYPVIFDIKYDMPTNPSDEIAEGVEMQQSFTVYVSITDGKKTSSAAELFITDYKTTPKRVAGGEDFEVSVTLRNIGGSTAKKIRLTYDGQEGEPGKALTPKNPLNTIRVDDLSPGKSTTVKFKMTASKDAIAGSQAFTVAVTYNGGEFTQLLTVDVTQPLDISVDEIQIPQELMSGESVMMPISILNKGKSAIYDVTCRLEMDGCYGSSVYIGEVQAGTTGYAEMKVFIGTLSQGSLYGSTYGELHITYKEADGSEYTDTTELRTTIIEPVIDGGDVTANAEAVPKVQPVSQWYVSVIVGVAVIAIAAAVIIIVSYERKLKLK